MIRIPSMVGRCPACGGPVDVVALVSPAPQKIQLCCAYDCSGPHKKEEWLNLRVAAGHWISRNVLKEDVGQ